MITSTHEIPLEPVASSALSAYGYEDGVLAVQFTSGHIVHYRVPEKIATAFREAPSKGAFYSAEIRRQFPAEKVTGACGQCGDIGRLGARCKDCGTADYQEKA